MARVLFIGNGVNNVGPSTYTWGDLIDDVIEFAAKRSGNRNVRKITTAREKPFHLLYEEIVAKACCTPALGEFALKTFIGEKASQLATNSIYTAIGKLKVADIITTNYEDLLVKAFGGKVAIVENRGCVKESKYGIFRHRLAGKTRLWFIHGYAPAPRSIILGYEQYAGMLQRMRNYVVTGPIYEKYEAEALTKRIRAGKSFKRDSWIDLFFTDDVHILGFGLDYVEMDIWWLLTYRSRWMSSGKVARTRSDFRPRNRIVYYIPDKYVAEASAKLQLLEGIGVEVVSLKMGADKEAYYRHALEKIDRV